jgi:hypothetical protein
MPGERLERVLDQFENAGTRPKSPAQLCEVTCDILEVSGAGVMLMSGDVPQGSLCTTDSVSNLIEELQYTLGEGPCIDAYRTDEAVAEVDLAHPETPRWLAFTPRVLEAGVKAVFGYPLREGEARVGALNVYQDTPGPLSDEQQADAVVMADVIAHWVLEVQGTASVGTLATELEGAGSDLHLIVHNAAGIVSVQRDISVAEALIRLRAHAFVENRLVRDVAQDVVSHRLRLV